MKVLVHGASIDPQGRLRHALVGLARRGHALQWLEGSAPDEPGITPVARLRDIHHGHADLVVGEGSPWDLAWRGWRLRARAALLATSGERLQKWGLLERWAWESLHSQALIDEEDSESVLRHAGHIPLERFVLWAGGDPVLSQLPESHDVELLERAGERALARQLGPLRRPAFFVDRDGTLIVEHGYLSDPARVELLPGVAAALRALQAERIPIVVVSNQSGIGRGKFSEGEMFAVMARLRVMLRAEGVELDAIYYCPHAPDGGCDCRKPGTVLLERAAEDQQALLVSSWMVGDKLLDAATGRAMGGTGVLVRTGYGRDEETRAAESEYGRPDRVYDGVGAAAAAFLAVREARDSA